ncbi:NAD(P)H-binding protein [Nocardioides marmorisolisilvae]|nr:NAD(P)H-binding protein [Nocardioides marmorisolisilvae]
MPRTALLAGATGLVGSHLLDQLLRDDHWDHVVTVGRRPTDKADPKLEQLVVPFPEIGALPAVDDVFSCLGTTIKVAGSQEAFSSVDHDAVVALAAQAQRSGAQQFLHVTALGASAGSRIFYNRVKGETERDVAAVGLPTTIAFRPSMIDGARDDQSRPGESLGLVAMRAVGPLLGKYRPNKASDIAAAMIREAKAGSSGNRVIEAGQFGRS